MPLAVPDHPAAHRRPPCSAHDYLAEQGIDEPVNWHPPADLAVGFTLPGPDSRRAQSRSGTPHGPAQRSTDASWQEAIAVDTIEIHAGKATRATPPLKAEHFTFPPRHQVRLCSAGPRGAVSERRSRGVKHNEQPELLATAQVRDAVASSEPVTTEAVEHVPGFASGVYPMIGVSGVVDQ